MQQCRFVFGMQSILKKSIREDSLNIAQFPCDGPYFAFQEC